MKTEKITASFLSDGPSAKEQREAMEARIASRKAERMKTETKHTDDILLLQGCVQLARFPGSPGQQYIARKAMDRVAESHAGLLAALESIVNGGEVSYPEHVEAANAAIYRARYGRSLPKEKA